MIARSLVASVAATAVAMALMGWARSAYQVRTLQERIMEWTLLLVPIELFEQGLQRFGANAKVLALYATTAGIVLALVGLGAVAFRRGPRAIVLTAAGLWLFAMAVVMPVTGAGFFANELFQDVGLTNASYAGLALAYAAVLMAGRAVLVKPAEAPWAVGEGGLTRRAFVGTLAGTGLAYSLTLWLGRASGAAGSSLPVASVADLVVPTETPRPAPPTPTIAPAAPVATPAAGQPAAAVPTTAPATPTASPPTPTPRPTPPPAPKPAAKQIKRDEIGSTTASGRKTSELAALFTPNEDWYITTKNAIADPVVDRDRWRLALDGELGKPVQLDLNLMYQLPAVEVPWTLECISNRVTRCGEAPFGCDLISSAKFKGVRLRDLLQLAGGLKPGAKTLVFFGADEFSSSLPATPEVVDGSYAVYEMNGQPLPIEHGYPVRLLVPNRYGMKNPKWIVSIRAIAGEHVDWYAQRGWSREGVVKTMARIDTPAEGEKLPAGEHRIAGIAYAGARGVSQVEFSVDGGKSWRPAAPVEPPVSPNVWLRWEGKFAFEGTKPADLTVRCVDGTGAPQPAEITSVEPNGQGGLHYISVYPG
jgi:DMSO/TMAO reductase YedYZ molybdopterin-dependent catalytic subunit